MEIGGLSDIDEAKGIIGKTVELEFKLANSDNEGSAELYAQRQRIAENMLVNVSATPAQFEQLGSGKISEDIFYSHYTDAQLEQLPDLYRQNPELLSSLTAGSIYPTLLTDTYHTLTGQDASGNIQSQQLKGFTILKFNGVKTVALNAVDSARVIAVAETRKLAHDIVWAKDEAPSLTGTLTFDGRSTVKFVGQEVLQGISGYNMTLYQVADTTVGEKVASQIKAGKKPATTDATIIAEGWAEGAVLGAQLIGFDPAAQVKIYDQQEGTFVLSITDSKEANEILVPTIFFRGQNKQNAENLIFAITNANLYDIEDIRVQDTQSWVVAKDPKSNDILNGAFFKFANVGQSQTGKPVVSINFDDKGKEIFCNITEENIGKQMAIFVGGSLMTSPVIQDKICGGSAQIDGTFDSKGAKELTENLNSGALPAPLLLSHEEKVSPTLGASALTGSFIAAGVGFIVIYILMFFMYGWKKANVVIITLIVFVAFLMAIFKLIGIVSSLSAIAAAILTVGMAVDANVLIFERLKEELAEGKSMHMAIEDAYERSWYPIRDGNVSTGLIGFLLFTMGVNVFKGFGTTILINMFLILLVNVPLTKELLLLFYSDKR